MSARAFVRFVFSKICLICVIALTKECNRVDKTTHSQKNRRKFVGNKKQPYLCTRNSTGGALPITKRPWGMV